MMHKSRDACLPKTPPVSVVTPSLNSMPFIEENIRSVAKQGYSPIEHIVIDGGSTDGTIALLAAYKEVDWISEVDSGQSAALNKGFRRAQGEIIGWLNSDDSYAPGAINFAVKYLLEHPGTDVIYSDVRVIDENSQYIRVAKGEPFSIRRLLESNIVKQPTVFMRKRVIRELGGVREDLHYVMDHELWLRAAAKFKFEYLPGAVLANFRLCPGTKSNDSPRDFMEEWIHVLEEAVNSSDEIRRFGRRALMLAKQQYWLLRMREQCRNGPRRAVWEAFAKCVSASPRVVFQLGCWKLLFDNLKQR